MVSNKQASTCAKICHVHRLRYEGIGFYLRHALVNVKKHLLSPTPDHDLFLKSLDHNSPFDSCHLPSQTAAPLSTSLHAFDLSLILPIELWCWVGSFRAPMTNSLSHSRHKLINTSTQAKDRAPTIGMSQNLNQTGCRSVHHLNSCVSSIHTFGFPFHHSRMLIHVIGGAERPALHYVSLRVGRRVPWGLRFVMLLLVCL